MHVVIAGGTGFLGSALAAALRRETHDVTVLSRRGSGSGTIRWTPNGTVGDWANALDDADAVINLAGESIAAGRWTAARKAAIRASRVSATRSLVLAIRQARRPPATFLSASAVGYYGSRGTETLTERSAPGNDFLARVCREWESEAMAAASATRVVLLRTGLVLDRNEGAFPRIALPFRLFTGGPVGSGRQYWSWIHRDDWVGLALWALRNAAVAGPINLTAPAPVTNREFAATLGRVMRRPAFMPAPAFVLRLALGEMADALLLAGQRVLPAAAEQSGYGFEYSALEPALLRILTA